MLKDHILNDLRKIYVEKSSIQILILPRSYANYDALLSFLKEEFPSCVISHVDDKEQSPIHIFIGFPKDYEDFILKIDYQIFVDISLENQKKKMKKGDLSILLLQEEAYILKHQIEKNVQAIWKGENE